jgi:aspartyl/asparaginyl beta-hydroxylase (cupin superfamily)
MFLETSQFDFAMVLQAKAAAIRQEFLQLTEAQFVPWPEVWLYNEGWSVFGLWALRNRLHQNCDLCPITAAAIEAVPGMTTAGFSCLGPGTKLSPHVGYTKSILRLHLGLIVPENCGICVGGETRCWEEGKCLVFDDTTEHSAWNDSDKPRIVLLVDFLRPGADFDPMISNEVATALATALESNASSFDPKSRSD